MEQTPSSPGRSPELPTVSSPTGETISVERSPETANEGVIERQESRGESNSASSQVATVMLPMPASDATQPIQKVDDTARPQIVLPTIANDDDLIEKEWVDKAKKVLAETKDDPYRREQEVNRIQSDYLLKRYGRELGSTQ